MPEGSEDQLEQVLKENAHADGRDQQRNARRFLHQQSSVRDALDQHARQRTKDDRPDHSDPNGQAAEHQQHICRISAHHDDVAMCKVDELDDAVDHAVPQGNQGINTPRCATH